MKRNLAVAVLFVVLGACSNNGTPSGEVSTDAGTDPEVTFTQASAGQQDLSELEARISELEDKLDGFNGLEARVEELESKVTGDMAPSRSLEGRVRSLESCVEAIKWNWGDERAPFC